MESGVPPKKVQTNTKDESTDNSAVSKANWINQHENKYKKAGKGFTNEALRVKYTDVTDADLRSIKNSIRKWGSIPTAPKIAPTAGFNESMWTNSWEGMRRHFTENTLGTCWIRNMFHKEMCTDIIDGLNKIRKWQGKSQNRETCCFPAAELSDLAWSRVKSLLPKTITLHGDLWNIVGVGPGVRVTAYPDAQVTGRIAEQTWHYDQVVLHDVNRVSGATFMIYLDDSFEGGALICKYGDKETWLHPKAGDAFIVSYDVWHRGEAVTKGAKHILRMDLEIERVTPRNSPIIDQAVADYLEACELRHLGKFDEAEALQDRSFKSCPELRLLRSSPADYQVLPPQEERTVFFCI